MIKKVLSAVLSLTLIAGTALPVTNAVDEVPSAVTVADSESAFFDGLVVELRDHFKARDDEFQLKIPYNEYIKEEDFFDKLLGDAVTEVGDPVGGDYLKHTLGPMSYGTDMDSDFNILVDIAPTYRTTAAQEKELSAAVDKALKSLDMGSGSDYDKTKAIYNYILNTVTYDYNHTNDLIFTAYGAGVNKLAVCQGYCLLFYNMLAKVGIESHIVPGFAGSGTHLWSLVNIDGTFYYADVTFDSTISEGRDEKLNYFFLRGSEDFDAKVPDANHTFDVERLRGSALYREYTEGDYLAKFNISPVAYDPANPPAPATTTTTAAATTTSKTTTTTFKTTTTTARTTTTTFRTTTTTFEQTTTTAATTTTTANKVFGDFTLAEIEASPVKPVLTLDSMTITPDQVGKDVEIGLVLSGADQKYASAGFHIFYDPRLTFKDYKMGSAVNKLSGRVYDTHNDKSANVFVCVTGSDDIGRDGVICHLTFTVPSDAKPGDFYPLDIKYTSNPSAMDLLYNSSVTEAGKLMNAYLFTKGIYNEDINYKFVPEAKDIALNPILANIGRDADGYISVAVPDETTTYIPVTTTAKTTSSTIRTTTTTYEQTTTTAATTNDSADKVFEGFTIAEIEASPVKPVLTIDSMTITPDQIGKDVEIDLVLSGADKKYASAGFHIFYDKRLTFKDYSNGDAVNKLLCEVKNVHNESSSHVFVSIAGPDDMGRDGVICHLTFTVPSDAKPGDYYPFDIRYASSMSAEDFLYNRNVDDNGKLMNAYLFTKGIYNKDTNYNFAPESKDIAMNPNLVNIGKDADGYISIAAPEETTTEAVPFVYGDANNDGKLSIADATAVLQSIVNPKKYGLSASGEQKADVDGVKGVTPNDALIIQQVDAGMYKLSDLPLKANK